MSVFYSCELEIQALPKQSHLVQGQVGTMPHWKQNGVVGTVTLALDVCLLLWRQVFIPGDVGLAMNTCYSQLISACLY